RVLHPTTADEPYCRCGFKEAILIASLLLSGAVAHLFAWTASAAEQAAPAPKDQNSVTLANQETELGEEVNISGGRRIAIVFNDLSHINPEKAKFRIAFTPGIEFQPGAGGTFTFQMAYEATSQPIYPGGPT